MRHLFSNRHFILVHLDSEAPPWDLVKRYSLLKRLTQIIAVCKRMKHFRRLLTELIAGHLSPTELQENCKFWIHQIQHFQHEIKILAKGGRLPTSIP